MNGYGSNEHCHDIDGDPAGHSTVWPTRKWASRRSGQSPPPAAEAVCPNGRARCSYGFRSAGNGPHEGGLGVGGRVIGVLHLGVRQVGGNLPHRRGSAGKAPRGAVSEPRRAPRASRPHAEKLRLGRVAHTRWSCSPPEKRRSVGTDITPKRSTIWGLASESTVTTRRLPSRSLASWVSTGPWPGRRAPGRSELNQDRVVEAITSARSRVGDGVDHGATSDGGGWSRPCMRRSWSTSAGVPGRRGPVAGR